MEGDLHRYTYRDCERRAKQLAQRSRGSASKPAIASVRWRGTATGIWKPITGSAAWVPCHTINPRLFPEQIAYIVNHAEDRYVFFDINFAPLVEAIAPQCPHVKGWVAMTDAAHLPSGTTPFLCYETLVEAEDGRYDWPRLDEQQASGVVLHVGHDRQPEGRAVFAPLDRAACVRRRAARRDEPVRDGRRAASRADVPRQRMGLPYAVPLTGGKLVLPGKDLDGKSLYQLMEAERVTFSAGVPTVWLGLLNYMRARPACASRR